MQTFWVNYISRLQEKVYDEINDVLGPNSTCVTIEDLKKLHYLDMVYKEAMRILSIAALIQRTVDEEITINDGNHWSKAWNYILKMDVSFHPLL